MGIDIGTSSVKVLAVDESGRTIALEKAHYPILTPKRGFREQDPEAIWQACLDALSAALRRFPAPPAAIGISSAMHSLILLSEEKKPLTNLILWADTRSRRLAEILRQREEGRQIYEATGTPIHALSPLVKIRWFQENEPELFRRAAFFADIKTYVIERFCGELLMDYSIASATGLFNLIQLDWNQDSLTYAGISEAQLPRLVDTSFRLPPLRAEVARQINIAETTAWIVGGSDGCLANLGSFAFDSRTLILSTGTSAALRYTSAVSVHDYEGQLFCYYLDPERRVIGGASNNGGAILNWFKESFYANEEMAGLLSEADSISATAEGLIFLPWLLGERAPIWDSRASGVFLGIRELHGRAHFARAVLEGLVLNLYRIFANVQRCNEEAGSFIISSGGLARAPVWNQLLADVFSRPVHTVQETETSAFGAILLALKATGQIADYQEVAHWQQVREIFYPDGGRHLQYQSFSKVVFKMYDTLKETFRLIDRE
jgi:gluconokinase